MIRDHIGELSIVQGSNYRRTKVDTAQEQRIEKLLTVKTELTILKPRLTEPYRSNIEACITLLDVVTKELGYGNDKERLRTNS